MEDFKPSPEPDGEEAKKRKVKPVLKKHHVEGDGPAESERKKKEIKWDEEIIEEHDQLRGSRQKVCHDKRNDCPAESSGHHGCGETGRDENAAHWRRSNRHDSLILFDVTHFLLISCCLSGYFHVRLMNRIHRTLIMTRNLTAMRVTAPCAAPSLPQPKTRKS